MDNNKIIFTGGGSAGHVIPMVPLIKHFIAKNWQVHFIGSKKGIENKIIQNFSIKSYRITTGKIRREINWRNLLMPFQVIFGIITACYLIFRIKPSIVFSKGGYVSFPVVVAAFIFRIPVIIHESDYSPGLANRMSYPFAKKVCLTFTDTIKFFSNEDKAVITGTPIREEIMHGNGEKMKQQCSFQDESKRKLLVIGGGSGSKALNSFIRKNIKKIITNFNVIHICGFGNIDVKCNNISNYYQFEYIDHELPNLLAYVDLAISRAGSNTIFELVAAKIPNILVPLSTEISRGEQLLNAKYFNNLYSSQVVLEDQMEDLLLNTLEKMASNLSVYKDKLKNIKLLFANQQIINLINAYKK